MRAASTAALCLAAALLAASSSQARAEFRICNSSGGQIKLAFGNNDSRFGWTSRGWWTLPSDTCQSVLYGEIARGNYYFYTFDGDSRPIAVPEAQTGGTFCVKDQGFDLRSNGFMTPQNTIACEAAGLKAAKFRVIEVGDTVADYTYTLVPRTMGLSSVIPLIKEATQNLPRPAASPAAVTPPAPPAVMAQTPAVQRPSTPSNANAACQRYPNLC